MQESEKRENVCKNDDEDGTKITDEHVHRNKGTHLSLLMTLSRNREIANRET